MQTEDLRFPPEVFLFESRLLCCASVTDSRDIPRLFSNRSGKVIDGHGTHAACQLAVNASEPAPG